jgi:hypothetical protein
MNDDQAKLLLRQLYDDDWIVRAKAIWSLRDSPELSLSAISRLFELTFDKKLPIQDLAQAGIKRLGTLAVPFLLEQTSSHNPAYRRMTIELLMTTGFWRGATWGIANQVLAPRVNSRPNWGIYREK